MVESVYRDETLKTADVDNVLNEPRFGAPMFEIYPPKSVVVGIDGSEAALRAARWAADEVADRDIPMRLLYVRELSPTATDNEIRQTLSAAEEAVYDAYNTIEALGRPVKVEMDIVEGRPVGVLVDASLSTPLLCIGNSGSGNSSRAGFGSTAIELMRAAHCSVTVVRSSRDPSLEAGRWVVAHMCGSPDDDAVLDQAFQEAGRRKAPLVLVTAYRSGFDLLQDEHLLYEHDRRMQAVLDRYVAIWSPRYPHVDVRTVTAYGTMLSYLGEHARTIQLVIVGGGQAAEIAEIVGPNGVLTLRNSDFALSVVR